MNGDISELKDKSYIKSKWNIINKIHTAMLSINDSVEYRIFPIYIQYIKDDKVIAILFFTGKFVNPDEVDLGLRLNKNPKIKKLRDASYMNYPGINFSLSIKNDDKIENFVYDLIKTI